jgi:hypothetical protein
MENVITGDSKKADENAYGKERLPDSQLQQKDKHDKINK